MISKDISLYIHIPFCISKCSYCDFFSIACKDFKNAIPQKYIDALCNEINYRINNRRRNPKPSFTGSDKADC